MKTRWVGYTTFALAVLTLSSAVAAAELRGRLVGIKGATIDVDCPGGSGSASIQGNGNFVVRGLPAGQDCSFSVRKGNARSMAIRFRTSSNLVRYSGTLSAYGNSILVTRQ